MILPKSPRKGALLRCNMMNDRVNLGVTIQLIFKFGFIGELWFAVGEAISLPQICENQR